MPRSEWRTERGTPGDQSEARDGGRLTNQWPALAEVTGLPGGRRPSVVSIEEEATGDGGKNGNCFFGLCI